MMRFFDVTKFVPFFERKRHVFVVHLLRDGLRMHRCIVSKSRGSVDCSPLSPITRHIGDLRIAFEEIKKSTRWLSRFRKRRFIFMLDPGFATSISGVVQIPRSRPKDPIQESDIEHSIAQSMWKLFTRERVHAASKMGLPELDLELGDVRVEEIRLDGHRVVDPSGFSARMVSVKLLITFLADALLKAYARVFTKEAKPLFGEGGILVLRALPLEHDKDAYVFVQIFKTVSDVFMVHGGVTTYVDTVPWGVRDLSRAVSRAFSVSESIADIIIARMLSGETSSHFLHYAERILDGAYNDFARGLGKTVERHGISTAYIMPFAGFRGREGREVLPENIFKERFKTRGGARIHFKPIAYEGKGASQVGPWDFSAKAAIHHFFFSGGDDTLNKIARRRARWLQEVRGGESEVAVNSEN